MSELCAGEHHAAEIALQAAEIEVPLNAKRESVLFPLSGEVPRRSFLEVLVVCGGDSGHENLCSFYDWEKCVRKCCAASRRALQFDRIFNAKICGLIRATVTS